MIEEQLEKLIEQIQARYDHIESFVPYDNVSVQEIIDNDTRKQIIETAKELIALINKLNGTE